MKRLQGHKSGVTLVEILIAMAVFALLGTIVYGSLGASIIAQQNVEAVQARTREVRVALLRMTRELQSAFIVKNANQITTEPLRSQTIFSGKQDGGESRLDFTSFAHQRTQLDINESDQTELSYFVRPTKEGGGKLELVRRESKRIDSKPEKGGVYTAIVSDVTEFEVEFYDFEKEEWIKEWDTTNTIGQPDRLPPFVRIKLSINEGDQEKTFSTIVRIPLTVPIMEVRP
jgi:general secretion pathway protein J